MGEVVERLGVDADHVIFGHTHRAGPLPGDERGLVAAGRHAPAQHRQLAARARVPQRRRPASARNPYWPGSVTLLRDEGPPELTNVLGDLDVPRLDG